MMLDQILYKKRVKKKNVKSSERPLRSILKAISWRIIGTLDTIFIAWFLSGEITLAFSIGSLELVTKMVLYFLHERAWNQVKWGK